MRFASFSAAEVAPLASHPNTCLFRQEGIGASYEPASCLNVSAVIQNVPLGEGGGCSVALFFIQIPPSPYVQFREQSRARELPALLLAIWESPAMVKNKQSEWRIRIV